jgi:hypothetical protein
LQWAPAAGRRTIHVNLLRIWRMQWIDLHKTLQPYLLLIATALPANAG